MAKKTIRIERIHLEQDAGKSIRPTSCTLSLIDLNRLRVALMEIVSKPDMSSPFEAASYVKPFVQLCAPLKHQTATWKKAIYAATPMFQLGKLGEEN